MIAASSDSGIAAALINAVRRLNRNRNRTANTRIEPISTSPRTFCNAVSMKLLGRNKLASSVTSCLAIAGRNWSTARSSARVTSATLEPNCACANSKMPGRPLMTAPLIAGAAPIVTVATSAIVSVPAPTLVPAPAPVPAPTPAPVPTTGRVGSGSRSIAWGCSGCDSTPIRMR